MIKELENNHLLNYFTEEKLMKLYEMSDLYMKAKIIVSELFKNKVDKALEPYVGHLFRVANRLDDMSLKVAGLLHDTLEDTEITYDDLLKIGFPRDILDVVQIVTNEKVDTSMMSNEEKLRLYSQKIDKIINTNNIRAIKVKLADMSDNYDLERLKALPLDRQEWFHKKYGPQIKKLKRIVNR